MSDTAAFPSLWHRLQRSALRVEQMLAVVLLLLILILTFAQVIARFVFNAPFFWTEELARHSYVWLSFVAAMVAMNDRSHITVELFEERMSRFGRLVLNCLGFAAVVVACLILVAGSWMTLIERSDGRSPALGIPTTLLYGVVYVAFVVMAIHALAAIAQLIVDYRAGREPESATTLPEGAA